MRVAVIGVGGMGSSLGRLLARAGHDVIFTGSRSPQKLSHAAELAGPNGRTDRVAEAIEEAGVVVMAVPFDRYPNVARQAGPALRGLVVVDTSNPITIRGGQVEFLTVPQGLTAAEYQQRRLGQVRLVKAFNLICANQIGQLAQRTGDQRVAIPHAGDDAAAQQAVATLITGAGFVPVDAGRLAEAALIEPTSLEGWPGLLTGQQARSYLAARRAGHPPTSRDMQVGISSDTGTDYRPRATGRFSRAHWNAQLMRGEIRTVRHQLVCTSVNVFGTDTNRLDPGEGRPSDPGRRLRG